MFPGYLAKLGEGRTKWKLIALKSPPGKSKWQAGCYHHAGFIKNSFLVKNLWWKQNETTKQTNKPKQASKQTKKAGSIIFLKFNFLFVLIYNSEWRTESRPDKQSQQKEKDPSSSVYHKGLKAGMGADHLRLVQGDIKTALGTWVEMSLRLSSGVGI